MKPIVASAEPAAGDAFLAHLSRLLCEVEEINRQLERIEGEMQQALDANARERFEEYR